MKNENIKDDFIISKGFNLIDNDNSEYFGDHYDTYSNDRMVIRLKYLIIIILLFISCRNRSEKVVTIKDQLDKNIQVPKTKDTFVIPVKIDYNAMKEIRRNVGLGLLKYKYVNEATYTKINFLNNKNFIRKSIPYDSIGSSDLFTYTFAYSLGNGLLTFNVIDTSNSNFQISNLKDSDNYFISKADEDFEFLSWEDYLKGNVFSIEFDHINNPLKKKPNYRSETIFIKELQDDFYVFLPIDFKGDWMKVKWEDEKNNTRTGWIRWKENGQLIIEIFYDA